LRVLTFLAFSLPAHAYEFTGHVIRVHDGDTVLVKTTERKFSIRIAGIDAPELAQPFGVASRDHLAALVLDKDVRIVWHKHDKYNRRVGKMLLGTTDAALAQLRAGLAWHYKQYAKEQEPPDRASYAEAETAARAKRLGLWAKSKIAPQPPWAFRHILERQREKAKNAAATAAVRPK
jgi:endonuclease YncB( thermonuclease family)